MLYKTTVPSPVGLLTLTSDGEALTGLWIEGQTHPCAELPGAVYSSGEIPLWAPVRQWLEDYFSGKQPDLSGIPLKAEGTPFRQQVWRLLCGIPSGSVTTYRAIARRISPTMAPQAVGGAVGHNPIAILIPCHRVVGQGGRLVGYSGGLAIKEALLQLEQADLLHPLP